MHVGGDSQIHGREDRTSVGWWATGRPVLVDPGTTTYIAGAAREWSCSAPAHDVAADLGRRLDRNAAVTLVSISLGTARDPVMLAGRPYGLAQVRRLVIDPTANRLAVTDTDTVRLGQFVQLDSRRRLLDVDSRRRVARFRDSPGALLTVRIPGRISSVTFGRQGVAGGWTYTDPPTRCQVAPRITIVGGTKVGRSRDRPSRGGDARRWPRGWIPGCP